MGWRTLVWLCTQVVEITGVRRVPGVLSVQLLIDRGILYLCSYYMLFVKNQPLQVQEIKKPIETKQDPPSS